VALSLFRRIDYRPETDSIFRDSPMTSSIRLHKGDISAADAARYTDAIAIDTETLGLVPRRDRLCVVQLSPGDGSADVIQIARGQTEAPNLVGMLGDPTREKIFHFGRFDIAVLFHTFGVTTTPVFCTKIASRLTRTYTDRHGLKDNLKELLDIDVSKVQQQSDWAAETLTPAQLEYAASDVLHLHALRDKLTARLERDGRTMLARACFEFLPTRAKLDLLGWEETDIFAHS
jgi:ribonuclease D